MITLLLILLVIVLAALALGFSERYIGVAGASQSVYIVALIVVLLLLLFGSRL